MPSHLSPCARNRLQITSSAKSEGGNRQVPRRGRAVESAVREGSQRFALCDVPAVVCHNVQVHPAAFRRDDFAGIVAQVAARVGILCIGHRAAHTGGVKSRQGALPTYFKPVDTSGQGGRNRRVNRTGGGRRRCATAHARQEQISFDGPHVSKE